MDHVEESVRKLLSVRRLGHDANQLLVDIMEAWGGSTQFAHDLYTVFSAPGATPFTKTNILEMIQKLVVNNTNHNITKIIDPSDLDDEEIDGQVAAMIRRAVDFQHERSKPHDGPSSHTQGWETSDPPPE